MKLEETNSVVMTIKGPSGSTCIIYDQTMDIGYVSREPYKEAGEAIKAFMEGEKEWLKSQELKQ